jgi:hypothetical protein
VTKRQNRDTYLPDEKVIGRVIDTSDKISQFLAELREQASDEKTKLHLDNLIGLQNELTGRIAEYREKAPWQVSNTYMQYVDPGSGKIDEMIEENRRIDSMNDATETALALNQELANELQPVSINEGVEEAADAFKNLQFMIEDNCRKISMYRSMANDF